MSALGIVIVLPASPAQLLAGHLSPGRRMHRLAKISTSFQRQLQPPRYIVAATIPPAAPGERLRLCLSHRQVEHLFESASELAR